MTRLAKDSPLAWLTGEFLGTFLLVFFGCGSVCAAVLHGAQVGIFQVAIVWGLGIAIAIHLTASLSGAHLNPAITIAAACFAGFDRSKIVSYIGSQLAGAFAAAAVLYVIFGGSLETFEKANAITRGESGSEASAMVFAEYFPNPGGHAITPELRSRNPLWRAAVIEVVGTAVLALAIFGLTDHRNTERPTALAPLMIGLTVTILISLLGPLTMACFNPARDLGPRLFSSLAGWGTVPFTANGLGWLVVYICAPILGGILGGAVWHRGLSPLYRSTHREVV